VTTTHDEDAIALLGIARRPRTPRLTRSKEQTVGDAPLSSMEMVPTLRKGLPSRSLESVSKQLGLSAIAAGALLGIPTRTLAKRLHDGGRLTPDASQRVFRLSRVVALATHSLGSIEKARHWLQAPNRVLGHEVPLHLLDTDIGTEAVLEELGRIEHGIFV